MTRAAAPFFRTLALIGLAWLTVLASAADVPQPTSPSGSPPSSGSPLSSDSPPPAPRAPSASLVIPASAAHQAAGDSWLVQTRWSGTQSRHLHGSASIRFDLSALHLKPGHHRLGVIARTGTRHGEPNAHIPAYSWRVLPAPGQPPSVPAAFQALDGPGFQAVLETGKPDSWGNWYGTLQSARTVLLRGDEHIEIANRENHGGVIALWIQSVGPLNAAELDLRVDAPLHAFTHGTRLNIHLRAHLPSGLPDLDATLVIDYLDLLTDQTASSRTPFRLRPGETHATTFTPALKPGVYRLSARIVSNDPTAPVLDNPSSAQLTVAVSPARLASDLPDDWPLGAHVSAEVPPLPGFKWYRYFAQWPDIHRSPDRFEWSRFDAVFAAVQQAGGRLLVASDGSPTWASARGKTGMHWSANATAYPPDDWSHLRAYLDAMLARYTDARGTLAAIEHCNEANTPDRWLGTTDDMLAQARVFQAAAQAAPHPVKTIALAVSAGDQRDYVRRHVEAGVLDHADAVSAHFYEELMSPELATPINSLPRHVAMLSDPMRAAGIDLPMINSESGIAFAPRVNGRIPPQNQLNALAESDPRFNVREPWLLGAHWRPVSERRAAATYVSGFVQLLALGVRQSFVFSQSDFLIDGAPSLPWVALGRLGDALYGIDYHHVRPLDAHVVNSDGKDGSPKALAYLLGRPDGRQLIIAWGFLSDTTIGRSKHWQPWFEPQPIRIRIPNTSTLLTDLYARTSVTLHSTPDGFLEFPCGEEPVFIEITR